MFQALKLGVGTIAAAVLLIVAYAVCAGIVLFAAAATSGALTPPSTDTTEDGWGITSFAADYAIDPDSTVHVVEQIEVDFQVDKHGIFRDLFYRRDCGQPRVTDEPFLSSCPDHRRRTYEIKVEGVTRGDGSSIPYQVSTVDDARHIKIGDPNELVTGKQSYVIRYSVKGALDAYGGHDELYWNVSGKWVVTALTFAVKVTLPAGSVSSTRCFQGQLGGDISCDAKADGPVATFKSFGPLAATQQLSTVAGFPKGTVAIPAITTEHKAGLYDFYQLDALELGGALVVALLGALAVGAAWWRGGRDRQYKTIYYLTNDLAEGTRPLLGGAQQVVVEFVPPEDLKPAQMGLILDERADALDVTATIIDLAVRGYIHIEEVESKSWFGGSKDWKLTRVKDADSALQAYEQALYEDIFAVKGSPVQISELRYKFASKLSEIQKQLYVDALSKEWFHENPDTSRTKWLIAGAFVAVVGLLAAYGGGFLFGRALLLSPLPVAGIALIPMSRAMARRTAKGSEALRRVLGFRLYIATAETRRQEFNEQAGIFARYLPYAIVFGCVDKWANAFKGLDDQVMESTRGWYTGGNLTTVFAVAAFSSNLSSFASGMSSTVSSTRSSGGGGGGFSGGGGGGGGGGSW
jgi:uncharacterized membrane protein YgcG